MVHAWRTHGVFSAATPPALEILRWCSENTKTQKDKHAVNNIAMLNKKMELCGKKHILTQNVNGGMVMQSVIMAGGFGTRLHPLTYKIPKPMVPVAGAPMMEHVINLVRKYGYTEAISLLYYHGDKISAYFGDGSNFGVNMQYIMAESDLGTAGSVKNAEELIKDDFIVISADVLTDFDLADAVKFHNDNNALATIVLTRHPTPLQFGIVIADENGLIKRFLEKPAWGQVFSDTINTGIYIFKKEVLDYIPKGKNFDFSQNLFPKLLENGERLYGYVAKGYWRDVGNLREYRRANEDALWEKVKVGFPGRCLKTDDAEIYYGENVVIDDDAEFEGRVIIGSNTKIAGGAKLYNTVVGQNVHIESGAQINQSVLWNNISVGAGSLLDNCTIASNVEIGAGTQIEDHAVIAEACKIGSGATIYAGVKIWPEKMLEDGAVLTESLIYRDVIGSELFTRARISGTINWDIAPEFATKVGAAMGATLSKGNGTLVVSRDPDRASQITARALFCGAMSAGMDVEDLGIVPIPVMRQYMFNHPRTAGVHIRKSPYEHRRQDLIFLSNNGKDLETANCRKVEQLILREGIGRADYEKLGLLNRPQGILEEYRKSMIEHVKVEKIRTAKFRLAVDYGFGAAAVMLPSIHEYVGADVVALNAFMDANRLSNTREEREISFERLASIVKALGAQLGFAIDPIGERLTIFDENGTLYADHDLLSLVLKLYLSVEKPQAVAVPISASMSAQMIAREAGVRVIHTKDDHLSMMEAALLPEVAFVGGTRGGFIFTEFGFACDAMFSTVKILELLAQSGKTLSQIGENLPHFHRLTREVSCPWHKKGTVMRTLIEHTEDMPREIIDGVRVVHSDAWILALPDAERPIFHVIAEGKTFDSAQTLAEQFIDLIIKCQSD